MIVWIFNVFLIMGEDVSPTFKIMVDGMRASYYSSVLCTEYG